MNTRFGNVTVSYSARGIPKYSIELWHDGLSRHRLIRGESQDIIRRKAELQAQDWAVQWSKKESIEAKRNDAAAKRERAADAKETAQQRTEVAQRELEELAGLLKHTLSVNDTVDWDELKNNLPFNEPPPSARVLPPVVPPSLPREPTLRDPAYNKPLRFVDALIPGRVKKKAATAHAQFENDHAQWEHTVTQLKAQHDAAVRADVERRKIALERDIAERTQWDRRRMHYEAERRAANDEIDQRRRAYMARDANAVAEYCDLVLSKSKYPECFPKEFEVGFDGSSATVVVDYVLPAPNLLPTLKAVRYHASREEFEDLHLTEAQRDKQYDDVLYQVALRTIHELFEADAAGAISHVAFNGIVCSLDRQIGKEVVACVLSVRVSKEEFVQIDLSRVDPKACFRKLKGVGSSVLHSLTPIPPIMQISREDSRFVPSYAVADSLNEGSNLASMPWQDFEHLIRELFEKEFAKSGGEVRVTQASRDGGVDAVAFDPDPIRGGKIVIQAKRYVNTVGVSAVRDLYGTVMNEGATKGILVTTSDFGADSYSFASGKPLVLLSGAQLLHMLQSHGHKARINIEEARVELKSQE